MTNHELPEMDDSGNAPITWGYSYRLLYSCSIVIECPSRGSILHMSGVVRFYRYGVFLATASFPVSSRSSRSSVSSKPGAGVFGADNLFPAEHFSHSFHSFIHALPSQLLKKSAHQSSSTVTAACLPPPPCPCLCCSLVIGASSLSGIQFPCKPDEILFPPPPPVTMES